MDCSDWSIRKNCALLCIAVQLGAVAYASETVQTENGRSVEQDSRESTASPTAVLKSSLQSAAEPSFRQRVTDRITDRSPTAGTVIGMFVLRPDNGFHIDGDIRDKAVVLEWNTQF